MKKNIFNKLKAVIACSGLLALGFAAAGCSNALTQYDDKAYITPVLEDSGSARTVFPTLAVDELTTISLSYNDNKAEKIYAIWDTYDEFKDATIALASGQKYTLTLTAYQGTAKLTDTVITNTLAAGENKINFTLEVVDVGTTTGSVNLTAKFVKSVNEKSNTVKLMQVNADGSTKSYFEKTNAAVKSMEDGTQYVALARDSVPAGTYKFEISVIDENDQIGYVSDYVYVYGGCSAAKAYNLTWTDMYTLAPCVYGNKSDHVTAVPDPDGKGVKITFNFADGDGRWDYATITSARTQMVLLCCELWNSDYNNQVQRYPTSETGKTTVDYYFPFGTDGETDIFEVYIALDTNKDGNQDKWIYEKVASDSDGANMDIFNTTATNKYNDAVVTVSKNGAVAKLSEDISTFLDSSKITSDYFNEVSARLLVRGGKTDWSDGTEDAYMSYSFGGWTLFSTWGGAYSNENYESLISTDGYNLSNSDSLDILAKHSSWWTEANVHFVLKDSGYGFSTYSITSDDTLYTPVKLNKYNFVLPEAKEVDSFSNSYESGTAVTLPTYISDGRKILGWYANKDFTGDAVTTVAAADNTAAKTFYGKTAKLFTVSGTYCYQLSYALKNCDTTITKFTKGKTVKVTVTGTPSFDLSVSNMTVRIGDWDSKNNKFTDGTMSYYPPETFVKDTKAEFVYTFDAEDFNVSENSTFWYEIPMSSTYDGTNLPSLADFSVKIELTD